MPIDEHKSDDGDYDGKVGQQNADARREKAGIPENRYSIIKMNHAWISSEHKWDQSVCLFVFFFAKKLVGSPYNFCSGSAWR